MIRPNNVHALILISLTGNRFDGVRSVGDLSSVSYVKTGYSILKVSDISTHVSFKSSTPMVNDVMLNAAVQIVS